MGRKRRSRTLTVAMNGRTVGRLTRLTHGGLRFAYATEWLDADVATPLSLSMPLSSEPYSGSVLESFLDNLLPDSEDIRRRMQATLDAESTRPFDLLAVAGVDCVGALSLLPPETHLDVRHIDASPVSDSDIARILREHRSMPMGMAPSEDDFRISIAGAQEKTAFLWYRDGWHRPQRATPTTHIFKLPMGALPGGVDLTDSVENEWLSLSLVGAFGLPVTSAEIRRFEAMTVLVAERFDRRWSDDGSWLIRLPVEDLCQAHGVPSARKYEADGGPGIVDVMDLLLQSLSPDEDRAMFLRAQVVFWLLAAIDGHAKNFSIFLHPGGRFRATPLYDVMSAYPLTARGELATQNIKLAMAALGKNRHYRWSEIRRRHWLSTAHRCRFPASRMNDILDDCAARINPAIAEVERALPAGFPLRVAEPVFEGVRAMKALLG